MLSVKSLAILAAMSLLPTHRQPPLRQLSFTPKSDGIDFSGMPSNLVPMKWLAALSPATPFEHESADSSANLEPS